MFSLIALYACALAPARPLSMIFARAPLARWPLYLLIGTLLASTTPLCAEELLTAQSLDPIVVTATLPSAPLRVEIDPKAPRQPVPASDGADLLKSIPGFATIRKGGSNGDPMLRGMAGSRLGLLIDGGQLGGGCPSRMDPATAYIAPPLYDRVRVIKGPQTVAYGPGNSAGTVLFEREPTIYSAPGFSLEGSLLGGDWSRADQMADLRAGNPNGYIGIAIDHTRSGDYADGDGQRVHSSWDRWSADTTFGWTPDELTRIELSAGKGDGQAAYAFSSMDGAQFLRESLALKFERKPTGGIVDMLQAQAYYNYADHVMDNYTLRRPNPASMMPMAMASDVARRTLGGRAAAAFNWSNTLQLLTGIDGTTNTHTARNGGLPGSMAGDWRAKPRLRDARMDSVGAFGELTWTLDAQRRVVGGARVDRASAHAYRLAPVGMDVGNGMGMTSPAAFVASDRSTILPAGFVRWEQDFAGKAATVHAGIGHVQRFPDYWELFGRYADASVRTFQQLAAEKTTQLDIGVQWRRERIETWLSGYGGVVRDFIVIDRGSGVMAPSHALNIGARIAGAEAGARYTLDHYWKADASVAWAWGQDTSRHRPLPQMPPLEGRFTLVRDTGRWSIGALWRVAAPQHRVAIGSGNIVGQDLGPSAGFAVISLNGGYRFSDRVKLAAGIDNLFDRTYADHVNAASAELAGYINTVRVNEPGRTAWVELRYGF